MTAGPTRRTTSRAAIASLAIVLLFLPLGPATAIPVPGPEDGPDPTNPSASPGDPPTFVHPPGLGRVASLPAVAPAASQVWYTQEGATISQINGSAPSGVKSLSVDIPLVSSPYPIGYELNGLTNRGDWYQIVVGDNWPGCSGYEMITEVWDNVQGSGPVGCDTTVSMTTGDLIRLGLNFTSSGAICMDLSDVTRSRSHSICQAQPDPGATKFVTLSSVSDPNGYFTGPMTEIANTTASSCPDYTRMPLVNYDWPAVFGITSYLPWSDEFELIGGSVCYSSGGGAISFAPGDPSTAYVDTASQTLYGPHWVAGQVFSYVDSTYGLRIQTDPVPLTNVVLAASATTISLNTTVTLSTTVSGGVSPYSALWALNGTIFANSTLQRNWTGVAAGLYRFQSYGVDRNRDVVGPSTAVSIRVNGPLAVAGISTSVATGNADVGQTVTFTALVSGGVPPYSFQWLGLPAECPGSNSTSVGCVPSTVGSYSISVSVTDANASVAASGPRAFTVFPAPTAQFQASATLLDVGQSAAFLAQVAGGSGNLSFAWAGLPTPCVPVNAPQISCTVTTVGLYGASVTATDSNGVSTATAGLAIQVFPFPSVTLRVDRPVADAGVNLTFTAAPTGGSGGFLLVWFGLPSGCLGGNHLLFQCAATSSGTYSVMVTATDSAGGTAQSEPVVLYAYPALGLTVTGPPTIAVGEVLSASANATGGSPGLTYQWSGLPPGCPAPPAAQLSCQPTISGEFNITVTAYDGGGGVSSVTYHLVVLYPPPSGGATTEGIPIILLAGLVLVAAAIIAAVAIARRRR